jgi:hypothetical protein
MDTSNYRFLCRKLITGSFYKQVIFGVATAQVFKFIKT